MKRKGMRTMIRVSQQSQPVAAVLTVAIIITLLAIMGAIIVVCTQ